MTEFVSLHNHTHFSILDALPSPKDLFLRAKELGQKALAITDHGTFSGAWDALKASRDTGVKLIIGAEFYFQDEASKRDEKFRHIILLAKNATGYRNILTLNYKGFDNKFIFGNKVYSVIDWKLLEDHSEGVICLTSCSNGILGQLLMKQNFDRATEATLRLKKIFGDDLGLEVQPNSMKRNANLHHDSLDQDLVNRQIIKLAKTHNIRIVATTNTHYAKKEESKVHDALLTIGSHQSIFSDFRVKYPVPEFYLKTGDEVKSFFERLFPDDADAICENSIYFADKCEIPDWIDPKFSNPSGKELPIFPVKDEPVYLNFLEWLKEWEKDNSEHDKNLEEDKLYLRYVCERELKAKISEDKMAQYRERLDEEIDVMEFHGFSSYMLIVADYINWARKNDIPVGTGRGSVGGSLIAFLLGIHEADPIKYNLIFARFHNKEKSSFPDIDTDFAPTGRDKVQEYLRNKYGEEHVAHVSNVNTITPKVFARDIARACEFGGSKETAVEIGTNIADAIPKEITSIESALEKVPLFAEYAIKHPELRQYASISGKYRAWSTHAGGLVISNRSLVGLVPVRRDKEGMLVLEYDKDRAEENGLIKMDLLGLSTLDIIEKTINFIKQAGKPLPVEPSNYDDEDTKTYDLISSGNTFCVFQLGTSGGTIDLCKKVKPKCVEDISHINSLARPSARDIRSGFIAAKEHKRPVSLVHPSLQRAFGNTYGFGLYEESLMYLAQDVAGWSLHEADRLRKLTKEKGKNPKKAQQWRSEFIEGGVKNNILEDIAKKIWDEVVDKFQGYGFNMSHSILYSMLSYKTAYLKAHYPVEFLLANLIAEVKSNAQDSDKNISKIKQEIRKNKVKILPPNINESLLSYSLIEDNKLLTGLDALKFVNDEAINDIISKRPFTSFLDFMSRVDSGKVRANAIQALAASGCLDIFKINRKSIFLYVSDYRKKLNSWLKKHDPIKEEFNYPWPQEKDWDLSEYYALENFYLGESFVCKPIVAYKDFFKIGGKSDQYATAQDLKRLQNKDRVRVMKAIVRNFFEFKIKKEGKYYGRAMVKAEIEDARGDRCSLTIFPDSLDKLQNLIKNNKVKFVLEEGVALSFSANANLYEDEMGLALDEVYQVLPPPQLPADLKAKKVSLKESKKAVQLSLKESSKEQLLEEIEDSLIDEGLIDPEEENDNN